MDTKIRALRVAAVCLGLLAFAGIAPAADRPYSEGPVLTVSAIHTEPGMFDAYMKYLATTWKQTMEAQKAAGIIVDYMVYRASPTQVGPDDPDLYLVTVYKDMAALDGLEARTDPVMEKTWGDQDKQNAAAIERGKMRTLLGAENMRQLILK